MKKLILCIGLIAILLPVMIFTGCIRKNAEEAAGALTTKTYDYTGFTGVDIGSAMKLELSYGTEYSVAVTAGENLFKHLHVDKNGDTLKIYTDGWSINWWWNNTTPKVVITMPTLEKLYISGASHGTVTGFKSGTALKLHASGASDLDMDIQTGMFTTEISGASNVKGQLTATGTDINISGASDINLTGTGGDFKMISSGASSSSLRYYVVNDADVQLSGASDGSLNISGTLNADLSGASTFNYYGAPKMGHISVTGASNLRDKTN